VTIYEQLQRALTAKGIDASIQHILLSLRMHNDNAHVALRHGATAREKESRAAPEQQERCRLRRRRRRDIAELQAEVLGSAGVAARPRADRGHGDQKVVAARLQGAGLEAVDGVTFPESENRRVGGVVVGERRDPGGAVSVVHAGAVEDTDKEGVLWLAQIQCQAVIALTGGLAPRGRDLARDRSLPDEKSLALDNPAHLRG